MAEALPAVREIDLDGPVRYRFWEGPEDKTFVLVHGLGGSSLSWMQAAPELSAHGQVVAIDLIGFGETPRAGRDTGLMGQRRAIARLIGGLGRGPVVLCGSSMGGALSILQAAVEPASVTSLVLTSSVYPPAGRALPHATISGVFLMYATPRVGEWFAGARYRRVDVERMVRLGFALNASDGGSIPEEVVEATVELERRRQADPEAAGAFLDAARSMLRLGRRTDVARRALDGVRSPVLVLHGRRDRFVPIEWAVAELDRHPRWQCRFFADLGHALQLEAPERWVDAVASWCARTIG